MVPVMLKKGLPEERRVSSIVITYLRYESIPRNAPLEEVCESGTSWSLEHALR